MSMCCAVMLPQLPCPPNAALLNPEPWSCRYYSCYTLSVDLNQVCDAERESFFTASPNDQMLTDCSCPDDPTCPTTSFLQVSVLRTLNPGRILDPETLTLDPKIRILRLPWTTPPAPSSQAEVLFLLPTSTV